MGRVSSTQTLSPVFASYAKRVYNLSLSLRIDGSQTAVCVLLSGRAGRAAPPPGGISLVECSVLRAPGLVDEKPAEQAGSRPDPGAQSGIAPDRANDRAAAGADGRAGERALLGRGHVGAGDDRQSKSSDYQKLFHEIPRNEFDQCDAGHG